MQEKRRFFLLAPILGFALAAVIVLANSGSAQAAYSNLPSVLPIDGTGYQFINMANGKNDAEGNGAFVPSSYFKVYAESPANQKIDFHVVNRKVGDAQACYWYKIVWGTRRLDSYGVIVSGYQSPSPQEIKIQGCTLGNNPAKNTPYSFTIPASHLSAQTNVPGHVGSSNLPLHETMLQMQVFHDPFQNGNPVPDPGDGKQTATLRLYIGAAGRLGFFGGRPATTYPSLDSQINVLSVPFRTPCNVTSNVNVNVGWSDMDYPPTTARQPWNPNGKVYEYSLDPFGFTGAQTIPISSLGGSGSGSFTVNAKPNYGYDLRFESVHGSNGVLINYPYDTGDFHLPCPENLEPVVVPGCNTVTVTNPGTWTSPGGNTFQTRTLVIVEDSAGNTLVNDFVGNGQTRTFSFTPYGKDVIVRTARERQNLSGQWNNPPLFIGGATYDRRDNCYSATCTLGFNSNVNGMPNGVKGGTGFFYASITNNGPLVIPNNLGGTSLSMYGTGFANGFYTVPAGFMPGQTYGVQLSGVVAPRGIGKPAFGSYLSYNGRPTLEPLVVCPDVAIDVYEPFNLIPRVTSLAMAPDPEDPDTITYNTQIEHNGGAPYNYTANPPYSINATSTRYLFLRRAGVQTTLQGPQNDNRDFITVNYNDTYTTPPVPPRYFQVGDQMCPVITIDKGGGYLGPNGSGDTAETSPASSEPPSTCETVENQPYTRSYMSDVVVGGNFDGSSVVGNGEIKTYSKGAAGSGVEFAAEALQSITGFSSAFLRSAAPTLPNGLSFANINNPPCSSSGLAGCFRGGRVVRDYFREDMKQAVFDSGPSNPPGGQVNLSSLASSVGGQTWYQGGPGKVEFRNPGVGNSFGGRHDVFVDGDVVIQDNVIYNSGPWGNVDQIPNLRLFVKGNIYISSSVGQLDGTYVAQPKDDGTGGTIYTCSWPNGDLYSRDDLYAGCSGRKLQVNGSFIAQNVKFLRTAYTLSDALNGCPPSLARETFDCDHAAESFRLPPEYFLSLPSGQPDGGQSNGRFDDIKTLPPLL